MSKNKNRKKAASAVSEAAVRRTGSVGVCTSASTGAQVGSYGTKLYNAARNAPAPEPLPSDNQ